MKRVIILFLFFVLFFSFVSAVTDVSTAKRLHRFWDTSTDGHFYATNKDEVVSVNSRDPLVYEGIMGYLYVDSSDGRVPLYRFWNNVNDMHIYVTSEAERTSLVADPNWDTEGIEGYIYPASVSESVPFYRYFLTSNDDNFYTMKESEKTKIDTIPFPPWSLFNYIGIEAYVGNYSYDDGDQIIVALNESYGALSNVWDYGEFHLPVPGACIGTVVVCSGLPQAACTAAASCTWRAAYTVDKYPMYRIYYDEMFGVFYDDGSDPHACDGDNKVVGLSANGRALAEIPSLGNYGTHVCYGDFRCEGDLSAGDSCNNGGEVIIRLSANTGALASDAVSAYPVKICCTSASANFCGDDSIDVAGGEVCDVGGDGVAGGGDDVLSGETCVSQGFASGTLACSNDCASYDTSACVAIPPVTCGNNIFDSIVETCDVGGDGSSGGGDDLLDGATCISEGFVFGVLTCSEDCNSYNTTDCVALPGSFCGDDLINLSDGEVCDVGSDNSSGGGDDVFVVGVSDCSDIGFASGTLACSEGCGTYNTTACVPIVPSEARWTDLTGAIITDATVGDTIQMVLTDASGVFDFEVFDNDLVLNDNIRVGASAITGVINLDGNLVANWTITDADYNNADDFGESFDEFYFVVDGEISSYLVLSPDFDNDPMVIDIASPSCGDFFDDGDTVSVLISAIDLDDKIDGTLMIGEEEYFFTNGDTSFDYVFDFAGNFQILANSVNSRGLRQRDITNIMIIDTTIEDVYVAACIDEPRDFTNIETGSVRFEAGTTRGINFTFSNGYEVIEKDGLNFHWTFSDGRTNHNVDGVNSLSYSFFSNYTSAGNNWATLDVNIKGYS